MTERVCIIPVRSGSKGVPHKNIRSFLGQPLLCHSVRHALDAEQFRHVAVTSDSDDYLDIARDAGATLCIKRPDALATDTANSMDVLFHALEHCDRESPTPFETIVLLQATSPLRSPVHIQEAIAELENKQLDSVVSVCAAKNSPYFNLLERSTVNPETVSLSKALPDAITRRQDAPEVFQLNGSVYAWRRAALLSQRRTLCDKTGIYQMPGLYSVDIDTQDDWAFAELAARLVAEQSPAQKDTD